LCGPGAEVDHKTPLNLGGRHCAKNLQALTYEEHKEKTRRDQTLIADARRKRRRFTSPQVSACPGSRPTSAS
jgi:5-methylcytosine-specific restriction endonuclease McrA